MRYILICLLLITNFIVAQSPYPTDAFTSPLDIPMVLAGNFGELRSNHFHAGLDIKTQQRVGLKVYAIGDGYVSRIKVQEFGYGKALYIKHPNGYTSVYAHLQKFAPEIEAMVKKKQYEQKSYETDIYLNPSDIRVTAEEVVAFSGNTGSSGGPHLHFEIRDTAQKPINPLWFGYEVKDTHAPRILGIYAYSLSEDAQVNGSDFPAVLRLTDQKDGSFISEKIYASGTIGIGLNTYDQQDLAYNKNGAYRINLSVNGQPKFGYTFNTFSFAESSYINTMIDYGHYIQKHERIQKCYLEPYNKLKIYDSDLHNGKLFIEDGMSYDIKLEVSDFSGNTSTVIIPVEGRKQEIVKKKPEYKSDNYVIAARDNIFKTGNATVFFPANTFYRNFFAQIESEDNIFTVNDNTEPVRGRYTLSIDTKDITDPDKDKMFIASMDEDGRLSYQSTYRKGDIFSTRTKTQGKFTISKDITPPVVRPANFRDGQWLSNFRYLKLIIEDDLSGIRSYEGKLNGEWILLEYEYKDNSLTYSFEDKDFDGSKYELEVRVNDNVGNSTTFKSTFHRK